MKNLICQVTSIGDNPSWIKAGLNYYDWNQLLIISTNDEKFMKISRDLKSELEQLANVNINKKLDKKMTKNIEILIIKSREILEFITEVKEKLQEIKQNNYDIFFNATSGLQTWKFAMYFIYTEEDFVEKYFYFPTDSPTDEIITPIEFYKPLNISSSLKKLLKLFKTQHNSSEDLMSNYDMEKDKTVSKGLISRYLNQLKELGLVKESSEKNQRKKIFEITEKGKWFI